MAREDFVRGVLLALRGDDERPEPEPTPEAEPVIPTEAPLAVLTPPATTPEAELVNPELPGGAQGPVAPPPVEPELVNPELPGGAQGPVAPPVELEPEPAPAPAAAPPPAEPTEPTVPVVEMEQEAPVEAVPDPALGIQSSERVEDPTQTEEGRERVEDGWTWDPVARRWARPTDEEEEARDRVYRENGIRVDDRGYTFAAIGDEEGDAEENVFFRNARTGQVGILEIDDALARVQAGEGFTMAPWEVAELEDRVGTPVEQSAFGLSEEWNWATDTTGNLVLVEGDSYQDGNNWWQTALVLATGLGPVGTRLFSGQLNEVVSAEDARSGAIDYGADLLFIEDDATRANARGDREVNNQAVTELRQSQHMQVGSGFENMTMGEFENRLDQTEQELENPGNTEMIDPFADLDRSTMAGDTQMSDADWDYMTAPMPSIPDWATADGVTAEQWLGLVIASRAADLEELRDRDIAAIDTDEGWQDWAIVNGGASALAWLNEGLSYLGDQSTAQMGDALYEQESEDGDVNGIFGDAVAGLIDRSPINGSRSPSEWAADNPEAVRNAYENGYQGLEGGEAVWALYAADISNLSNLAGEIIYDPLTWVELAMGPLGWSARIATGAARTASTVTNATRLQRATEIGQRVYGTVGTAVSDNVIRAMDFPFNVPGGLYRNSSRVRGAVDSIARRTPFQYSDRTLGNMQGERYQDMAGRQRSGSQPAGMTGGTAPQGVQTANAIAAAQIRAQIQARNAARTGNVIIGPTMGQSMEQRAQTRQRLAGRMVGSGITPGAGGNFPMPDGSGITPGAGGDFPMPADDGITPGAGGDFPMPRGDDGIEVGAGGDFPMPDGSGITPGAGGDFPMPARDIPSAQDRSIRRNQGKRKARDEAQAKADAATAAREQAERELADAERAELAAANEMDAARKRADKREARKKADAAVKAEREANKQAVAANDAVAASEPATPAAPVGPVNSAMRSKKGPELKTLADAGDADAAAEIERRRAKRVPRVNPGTNTPSAAPDKPTAPTPRRRATRANGKSSPSKQPLPDSSVSPPKVQRTPEEDRIFKMKGKDLQAELDAATDPAVRSQLQAEVDRRAAKAKAPTAKATTTKGKKTTPAAVTTGNPDAVANRTVDTQGQLVDTAADPLAAPAPKVSTLDFTTKEPASSMTKRTNPDELDAEADEIRAWQAENQDLKTAKANTPERKQWSESTTRINRRTQRAKVLREQAAKKGVAPDATPTVAAAPEPAATPDATPDIARDPELRKLKAGELRIRAETGDTAAQAELDYRKAQRDAKGTGTRAAGADDEAGGSGELPASDPGSAGPAPAAAADPGVGAADPDPRISYEAIGKRLEDSHYADYLADMKAREKRPQSRQSWDASRRRRRQAGTLAPIMPPERPRAAPAASDGVNPPVAAVPLAPDADVSQAAPTAAALTRAQKSTLNRIVNLDRQVVEHLGPDESMLGDWTRLSQGHQDILNKARDTYMARVEVEAQLIAEGGEGAGDATTQRLKRGARALNTLRTDKDGAFAQFEQIVEQTRLVAQDRVSRGETPIEAGDPDPVDVTPEEPEAANEGARIATGVNEDGTTVLERSVDGRVLQVREPNVEVAPSPQVDDDGEDGLLDAIIESNNEQIRAAYERSVWTGQLDELRESLYEDGFGDLFDEIEADYAPRRAKMEQDARTAREREIRESLRIAGFDVDSGDYDEVILAAAQTQAIDTVATQQVHFAKVAKAGGDMAADQLERAQAHIDQLFAFYSRQMVATDSLILGQSMARSTPPLIPTRTRWDRVKSALSFKGTVKEVNGARANERHRVALMRLIRDWDDEIGETNIDRIKADWEQGGNQGPIPKFDMGGQNFLRKSTEDIRAGTLPEASGTFGWIFRPDPDVDGNLSKWNPTDPAMVQGARNFVRAIDLHAWNRVVGAANLPDGVRPWDMDHPANAQFFDDLLLAHDLRYNPNLFPEPMMEVSWKDTAITYLSNDWVPDVRDKAGLNMFVFDDVVETRQTMRIKREFEVEAENQRRALMETGYIEGMPPEFQDDFLRGAFFQLPETAGPGNRGAEGQIPVQPGEDLDLDAAIATSAAERQRAFQRARLLYGDAKRALTTRNVFNATAQTAASRSRAKSKGRQVAEAVEIMTIRDLQDVGFLIPSRNHPPAPGDLTGKRMTDLEYEEAIRNAIRTFKANLVITTNAEQRWLTGEIIPEGSRWAKAMSDKYGPDWRDTRPQRPFNRKDAKTPGELRKQYDQRAYDARRRETELQELKDAALVVAAKGEDPLKFYQEGVTAILAARGKAEVLRQLGESARLEAETLAAGYKKARQSNTAVARRAQGATRASDQVTALVQSTGHGDAVDTAVARVVGLEQEMPLAPPARGALATLENMPRSRYFQGASVTQTGQPYPIRENGVTTGTRTAYSVKGGANPGDTPFQMLVQLNKDNATGKYSYSIWMQKVGDTPLTPATINLKFKSDHFATEDGALKSMWQKTERQYNLAAEFENWVERPGIAKLTPDQLKVAEGAAMGRKTEGPAKEASTDVGKNKGGRPAKIKTFEAAGNTWTLGNVKPNRKSTMAGTEYHSEGVVGRGDPEGNGNRIDYDIIGPGKARKPRKDAEPGADPGTTADLTAKTWAVQLKPGKILAGRLGITEAPIIHGNLTYKEAVDLLSSRVDEMWEKGRAAYRQEIAGHPTSVTVSAPGRPQTGTVRTSGDAPREAAEDRPLEVPPPERNAPADPQPVGSPYERRVQEAQGKFGEIIADERVLRDSRLAGLFSSDSKAGPKVQWTDAGEVMPGGSLRVDSRVFSMRIPIPISWPKRGIKKAAFDRLERRHPTARMTWVDGPVPGSGDWKIEVKVPKKGRLLPTAEGDEWQEINWHAALKDRSRYDALDRPDKEELASIISRATIYDIYTQVNTKDFQRQYVDEFVELVRGDAATNQKIPLTQSLIEDAKYRADNEIDDIVKKLAGANPEVSMIQNPDLARAIAGLRAQTPTVEASPAMTWRGIWQEYLDESRRLGFQSGSNRSQRNLIGNVAKMFVQSAAPPPPHFGSLMPGPTYDISGNVVPSAGGTRETIMSPADILLGNTQFGAGTEEAGKTWFAVADRVEFVDLPDYARIQNMVRTGGKPTPPERAKLKEYEKLYGKDLVDIAPEKLANRADNYMAKQIMIDAEMNHPGNKLVHNKVVRKWRKIVAWTSHNQVSLKVDTPRRVFNDYVGDGTTMILNGHGGSLISIAQLNDNYNRFLKGEMPGMDDPMMSQYHAWGMAHKVPATVFRATDKNNVLNLGSKDSSMVERNDNLRRGAVHGHYMNVNGGKFHDAAVKQIIKDMSDSGAFRGGSVSPREVMVEFNKLYELKGGWSQYEGYSLVRRLLGNHPHMTDEVAHSIAQRAELHHATGFGELVKGAEKAVNSTLFSYRHTDADEMLGLFLGFHFWASRALPAYGKIAWRHKAFWEPVVDAYDWYGEQAEQRGWGENMAGFLRFMVTPGGIALFSNPLMLVDVMGATGMYFEQTGQRTAWEEFMNMPGAPGFNIPMAMVLQLAGQMPNTPSQNPLGYNSETQAITATANAIFNYMGFDVELPDDPLALATQWAMARVNEGTGGTLGSPPRNRQATEEAQVHAIIVAQALDEANVSEFDELTDAQKLEVFDAYADPDHPWAQEADRIYDNAAAIRSNMNLFVISGNRQSPESQIANNVTRQSDDEIVNRRAVVENIQSLLSAAGTEGIRVAPGMFMSPRGLTPQEQRTIDAARAASSTNAAVLSNGGDAAELEVVADARRNLGTPETQAAWNRFSDIAFGETPPEVRVNGMVYSPAVLATLSRDEREYLANLDAQQRGVSELLAQQIALRNAHSEEHPELKPLNDWSNQVENYVSPTGTGAEAWWQDVAQAAPDQGRYYEELVQRRDSGQMSQDSFLYSLTSADAYFAWKGRPTSVYDTTNNWIPYNPAAGQGGTGPAGYQPKSPSEQIVSDLSNYYAAVAEVDALLLQAGYDTPYGQLSTFYRQTADNLLAMNGVEVPRLSQAAQNYLIWARYQQTPTVDAYMASPQGTGLTTPITGSTVVSESTLPGESPVAAD